MTDKHWGDGCCYTVEGASPSDSSYSQTETISLPRLLEEQRLEKIDFMKMDIEGSEFAIFSNATCLEMITSRVEAMAVEFHLHYLRVVLGHSAPSAVDTLLTIIQGLETSGYDVILSHGRDARGHRTNSMNIDENTYCIDMWATRHAC
jgi:hypothetical protein